MARITWLADVLRDAGLNVGELGGWLTAGGSIFEPVGVLIHHTASRREAIVPSLRLVREGRPDLPGPLCHVLIGRDGTCHIVATGRANHAGPGGPIPGRIGKDQGNTCLVGIEAENDGVGEPWPPVVIDAMERATAAILARLGQPAAHVWGHKEWAPGRKIDPRGIDMDQFRAAVARRMTGGATVPDNKQPTDLTEQWQDMLLANGADLGPAGSDGQFGRLTLSASQTVLDHRNQLLGQMLGQVAELEDLRQANATSSATIARLTAVSNELLDVIAALDIQLSELRVQLAALDPANVSQAVAEIRAALDRLEV